MTKVTTLAALMGGKKEQGKKKPIEFVCVIPKYKNGVFSPAATSPNKYGNVVLAMPASNSEVYDVIIAYDNDISLGVPYLGHWNDGVVE